MGNTGRRTRTAAKIVEQAKHGGSWGTFKKEERASRAQARIKQFRPRPSSGRVLLAKAMKGALLGAFGVLENGSRRLGKQPNESETSLGHRRKSLLGKGNCKKVFGKGRPLKTIYRQHAFKRGKSVRGVTNKVGAMQCKTNVLSGPKRKSGDKMGGSGQ